MDLPVKQGLYDPRNEHDSCGVGFVADIKGRKSHDIVRQGLQILVNLDHRGAVGADPLVGDGAGCMIQTPDALLRGPVAQAAQLARRVGRLRPDPRERLHEPDREEQGGDRDARFGAPGRAPVAAQGVNTQSLFVYVDEVEAHHDRALAAGARITVPLADHDYGPEHWRDRGYACVDPDGHLWWFVERVRG